MSDVSKMTPLKRQGNKADDAMQMALNQIYGTCRRMWMLTIILFFGSGSSFLPFNAAAKELVNDADFGIANAAICIRDLPSVIKRELLAISVSQFRDLKDEYQRWKKNAGPDTPPDTRMAAIFIFLVNVTTRSCLTSLRKGYTEARWTDM